MYSEKVSIIIPCYNGAATIKQAIYGVINQTYRPIELIVINDGSTDKSDSVITGMAKEIKNANIEFIYQAQKNKGLGGAINTGLKYVTGEFLAWCDADDELLPTSVEKRIIYLNNHPNCGSVSSNAVKFKSLNGIDKLIELVTEDADTNSKQNQFMPLIMGKSLFCAGCHIVRTDIFCKSHGGMSIYPARHGQNWQMLLPVYYTSKHGFINEPLYKYRIDDKSMSNQVKILSFKQFYKRQNEYIEIVQQTLNQINSMHLHDKKRYLKIFKNRIHIQNLDYAMESGNKAEQLFCKIVVKWEQIFHQSTGNDKK